MAFFISICIFVSFILALRLPQRYSDYQVKTDTKGAENPMFFLPQSVDRPPPIGFPLGVSKQNRSRLFPENKRFSRPPKGGDNMAVFRIEKPRDYTVMSNHHLRNAGLSLKSKGLLSMMLSLPESVV